MTDSTNTPMIPIDALRAEADRRTELAERQISSALGHGPVTPLSLFRTAGQRKLIQKAASKELEMGFEYRQEAIAMALELRLQSFRETCNQVLVNGKTRLREQRLQYFTETYAQVERRLNNLTEEFLEEVDHRFQRLDRFANPIVREKEEARLQKRLNNFIDTFEKLMASFAGILNEEIGQPPVESAPEPPVALETDPETDDLLANILKTHETATSDHSL
ncbi:MAG TPA: hypothetical protein ENK26_08730 [Gammaproteobacteria bacterium]|nr:hypothetical protein [Gammaproteobacteria bacterium]